MKYKLVLEYDGTGYSGWQIQPDLLTIQGTILSACRKVFGEDKKIDLYGAGRTDGGVHAMGQVAHLSVDTDLSPEDAGFRINNILPPDISILQMEVVPDNFHARHDALARTYSYRISQRSGAEDKRYCMFVHEKLNLKAMQEAATQYLGKKDFKNFGEPEKAGGSTIVEIYESEVTKEADVIEFRVTGSHFLWKMVRRMTGLLLEVGLGKIQPAEVREFFRNRSAAEFTVPPKGLFLEQVHYEGDETE